MLLCRTVPGRFGLDFERLMAETPSPVFEQWRVLYDMEPWDAERTDEAMGTLIAHLVAVHGVEPKTPSEYMRLLRSEAAVQDQAGVRTAFENLCRQMEVSRGGAETRKTEP
jgi:hypothetical protein